MKIKILFYIKRCLLMFLILVTLQNLEKNTKSQVNAQSCPINSTGAAYSKSYTIQATAISNWNTAINLTFNFLQAYCFSNITSNLFFANNSEITDTSTFAIKR